MTLRLDRVTLPLAHFTLDVSFSTNGAATALYGPSGSGKTTILELIAGLRKPLGGEIFVDGEPMRDRPARDRRVGYVTQDDTLFPHLSVRGNLLYGAGEDTGAPRVAEVLEISHLLDRGVRHLSGGERKRVALARALLSNPKILLLDEPLTGVEVALRKRVLDYLVRVRTEFPVPIIFVTHELDEAKTLCDEIVRIEAGRIATPG